MTLEELGLKMSSWEMTQWMARDEVVREEQERRARLNQLGMGGR